MADPADGPLMLRRSGRAPRFAVIGAYVTDCFVSTARLPGWGEEHEARAVWTQPGGKALNQAISLARLGSQVTAVGVVGDDGVGRDILAALAAAGVDAGGVEVRGGVPSAVCVCFVGDEGENAIVWHIDDAVAVTAATVAAAAPAIGKADAVLVTFEMPAAAIGAAIRAASDLGAMVFVQPAPPLADPAAAAALPWDLVDVVMLNESEARVLLGGTPGLAPGDLAGAVAARTSVGIVVVTLGAAGCAVFAAGSTVTYPAQRVAAVDTTGAGDAFAANFAASIVGGAPVADAVHAAQAAAARAVLHVGGHQRQPAES
jgi:ribokinase